jgi:hypothetical protein
MVWVTLMMVLRIERERLRIWWISFVGPLPNLLPRLILRLGLRWPRFKVGFEVGIEIPKVAKARVFSNYLEIFVHNLETVHKDIASYWVDEAAIVLLELHNKVTLVLYLLHYHSGKLPSTLVMMGNLQ